MSSGVTEQLNDIGRIVRESMHRAIDEKITPQFEGLTEKLEGLSGGIKTMSTKLDGLSVGIETMSTKLDTVLALIRTGFSRPPAA